MHLNFRETIIRHGACNTTPFGRPLVAESLFEVENLVKHFPPRKGMGGKKGGLVRAVDGISFSIKPGETLGLVGESGCGKSTTGRTLLRLLEPTSGALRFEGRDVTAMKGSALRDWRRSAQIIFQDPYASLNPRMTVGDIVSEAFAIHGIYRGAERNEKVRELLSEVGMKPEHMKRHPHEFSGGQRQRIGIARGIALNPRFIVCDEPVSALDVSIQAQIVNLLKSLQQKHELTYLFIAHDLGVVRHISDRIAVMYLGKIVELSDRDSIIDTPRHPYTQALLSAIPQLEPGKRRKRVVLSGEIPNPINPPSGCRFHTRCPIATDRCAREEPLLRTIVSGHETACHHAN
jgi:oligopeptide transport system ATP-binding protein